MSQLNPHAKKQFLNHCVEKFFMEKCFGNKFHVFKFALISKNYLSISQQVYKLNLDTCSGQDFNVFICPIYMSRIGFYMSDYTLTYDQVCNYKVNQLLNLRHVGFSVNSYQSSADFKKLMGNFEAKFDLHFSFSYTEKNLMLLKEFSSRVYQIESYIKMLLDPRIPSLNLDFCFLYAVKSFDQMKKLLLKHKIKRLAFHNSQDEDENFNLLDSNFFNDFPVCPKLHELKLKISQNKNGKFFDVLPQLMTYLPNLKRLKIHINFNKWEYRQNDDPKHLGQFIVNLLTKIRAFEQQEYFGLQSFRINLQFNNMAVDFEKVFDETLSQLKTAIKLCDDGSNLNDVWNEFCKDYKDHSYQSKGIYNVGWKEGDRKVSMILGAQIGKLNINDDVIEE